MTWCYTVSLLLFVPDGRTATYSGVEKGPSIVRSTLAQRSLARMAAARLLSRRIGTDHSLKELHCSKQEGIDDNKTTVRISSLLSD